MISILHMHKNSFFLALFVLVALSFLYFAATTTRDVCKYASLSERGDASVNSVEIERVKSNQFRLVVSYYLKIVGGSIENKGYLGSYPNHYAAERAARMIDEANRLSIWYNPENPLEATFEHNFPIKSLISSFVLFGLSIYLFFLGRFVGREARDG